MDDKENCIEVEETECRVQEIPVPEDEEEAKEGTADVNGEEEVKKEPTTTTTTTTEAPEEEPENTAILFFDD